MTEVAFSRCEGHLRYQIKDGLDGVVGLAIGSALASERASEVAYQASIISNLMNSQSHIRKEIVMPQVTPSEYRAALFIIASLLTACSNQGGMLGASTPASSAGSSSITAGSTSASKAAKAQEPTTYVANTNGTKGSPSISIYANGGSTFLRSISPGYAFTVDAKGHLFVSEPRTDHDGYPLNIYADQGATLVQTLLVTRNFYDMQVDANGNLFGVCASDRVCEYPAGKGGNVLQPHISRVLQFDGGVGPIALDPKGDVAVVTAPPSIAVFPPGKKKPTWSIPLGNDSGGAMIFDGAGNLYVTSYPAGILVFAPGKTSPSRTIASGAESLAIDHANNLYVLTVGPEAAAVSVYPQGKNQPSLVITSGLIANEAYHLAVSPSGEVFVGNAGLPGNVVVYASGKTRPLRTITDQIDVPDQIGLGP
jgi:hypothetical protein